MHMDGFDRLLEVELARVLDPVVKTPAPPRSRGWRDGRSGSIRIFQGGLREGGHVSLEVPEVIPVVAPVPITVPTSAP